MNEKDSKSEEYQRRARAMLPPTPEEYFVLETQLAEKDREIVEARKKAINEMRDAALEIAISQEWQAENIGRLRVAAERLKEQG